MQTLYLLAKGDKRELSEHFSKKAALNAVKKKGYGATGETEPEQKIHTSSWQVRPDLLLAKAANAGVDMVYTLSTSVLWGYNALPSSNTRPKTTNKPQDTMDLIQTALMATDPNNSGEATVYLMNMIKSKDGLLGNTEHADLLLKRLRDLHQFITYFYVANLSKQEQAEHAPKVTKLLSAQKTLTKLGNESTYYPKVVLISKLYDEAHALNTKLHANSPYAPKAAKNVLKTEDKPVQALLDVCKSTLEYARDKHKIDLLTPTKETRTTQQHPVRHAVNQTLLGKNNKPVYQSIPTNQPKPKFY